MEFGSKEYVDSMILGSLMGDGHINAPRGNNINPTIGFTAESVKEVKYLKLKYDLVNKFYKTGKIRKGHFKTNRFDISSKEKELTQKMIDMTRLENNKRKYPDIKDFNEVALLYWYIDDGSLSLGIQKRPNGRKSTISRSISIALKSYKTEDTLEFMELINKKFNLNFKPKFYKGKTEGIRIKKLDDMVNFLELMNPLLKDIPKEQYYKFCMGYYANRNPKEDYYKYNKCNFHENLYCNCRDKQIKL